MLFKWTTQEGKSFTFHHFSTAKRHGSKTFNYRYLFHRRRDFPFCAIYLCYPDLRNRSKRIKPRQYHQPNRAKCAHGLNGYGGVDGCSLGCLYLERLYRHELQTQEYPRTFLVFMAVGGGPECVGQQLHHGTICKSRANLRRASRRTRFVSFVESSRRSGASCFQQPQPIPRL